MKPILVIGQLNGSNFWEDLDIDKYSQVIFLGNLVPSDPGIPAEEKAKNLSKILTLRRRYNEKVKVLVGYEDLQYLFPQEREFSNAVVTEDLSKRARAIFSMNKMYVDFMYQQGRNFFCYGPITQSWLKQNIKQIVDSGFGINGDNLGNYLNYCLKNGKFKYLILTYSGTNLQNPPPFLCSTMNEVKDNIPYGLNQFITGEEQYENVVKIGNTNASVSFCNTIELNVRRNKLPKVIKITNEKENECVD